jgi:PAS domain S-box-containing protein
LRPSQALVGFALLLVAIVAGVAAYIVAQARENRLAEAEREVTNLTRVLAEQTERTFQSVDFLLIAITEELRAGALGNDADAVHHLLRTRADNLPHVHGVAVIGADGVVRHDSLSPRPLPVEVRDRPYFTVARDGAGEEAYVGEPIRGRSHGKMIINLSRRLTGPDGGFSGVVMAAMEPTYFARLYDEIDPDGRFMISLVRDDGVRLIRHPVVSEEVMAQPIPANSPVRSRLASAPGGTFRAVGVREGVERIYAYRRLNVFPIHVVVALPEAIVLAPWRREAVETIAVAAVLAGLLCGLIGMLGRQVRRGEALTEALAASETRFRDYAEASSDWFWEQDETLRFTYFSGEAVDTAGVQATRTLGRTRREIASDRGESHWAAHETELAARLPFRSFRYQWTRPDGEVRYIEASGRPIFDEHGTFRGYRGTGRDVTPEILAERRLLEAKAEAEAASAAKGEFLAVISHELRTPLNAIIGFSEVMAREILGPIGRPKYREYAADILYAGQHLLKLINDVLDMSKIEARKMELHETEFDIGAAVESCVRLIQPRAAAAGVSLVNWVSPELPRLLGDETRFRQALLNLLSNAVKFTPVEGEVKLRSHIDENGLEISIRDTGIGMSAKEVEIALQPFRQVEGAMNRTQEGTGLGLPLARAFIELHGGHLVIESATGEGTLVRMRLPSSRLIGQRMAAE